MLDGHTDPIFEVSRFGCSAEVVKDGKAVWGPGSITQAEQRRDCLEHEARFKSRGCITCGDTFMSEGAHHRMCNRCRKMGASADMIAI